MKYCTKCGNKLNDEDLYCAKCGGKQNYDENDEFIIVESEMDEKIPKISDSVIQRSTITQVGTVIQKGAIACPHCKGKGYTLCKECNLNGKCNWTMTVGELRVKFAFNGIWGSNAPLMVISKCLNGKCSHCKGSGKVSMLVKSPMDKKGICASCSGTGKCPLCQGTGKCSCDGTGEIECPYCDGTGIKSIE